MKGIITKNGKKYTLTIKHDGVNLYKQKGFLNVKAAQNTLKIKKEQFQEYIPFLKSYPDLEGKVIDYYNDGVHKKVKVVGCDFHVGITFVDASNNKNYVNCIRGPLSPQGKKILKVYPERYNVYPAMFFYAVKSILKADYSCNSVRSLSGAEEGGSSVSAASCAFGA